MEVNVLKEITTLKFNTQKELLTEMSKNTYIDLQNLIKGRECTNMKYDIKSYSDPAMDMQMTVLFVVVEGKQKDSKASWKDSDTMYYISRCSVKQSNIEKVVRDMTEYYKKEVLHLEG